MTEDFDAVVIGGGPSGSTLAAALALAGWRVALCERAAFPRRKVCGEFLSATSRPVIARLGLLDRWERAAGPEIRRVALHAGDRTVEAPMPDGEGFGRALGRDRLDAMLLDRARAAGVHILQPARATRFRREAAGGVVEVAGEGGEAGLRAPVVVAAHGSWEPGPLPSQLPKRHGPRDLLGFKAYLRGGSLAPDLMPLLRFPGGYGGLVTADAGRLSLSLCIRRDALEAVRRPGRSAGEAVHAHLLASVRGVREAIGDASIDGAWLASPPIRPGIRASGDDGLLRVGNAAGESHPAIAEGVSMAIQSAWLLAEALGPVPLREARAIEAAQARYARAFRRQFAGRIHAAELIAALALRPATAEWAGALVARVPALLTLGARLAGKARPLPEATARAG